jgi:hypothetical protein
LKRKKTLSELRAKVVALPAAVGKPRATLKNPQPYLMEIGDLLVYPMSGRDCINPYFARSEDIRGWRQDGWGAALIIDRGRAFDFLTWYRPLTLAKSVPEKPSVNELKKHPIWFLGGPGTCSVAHFKRMRLEKLGTLPVNMGKRRQRFPEMQAGDKFAIEDISVCYAFDGVDRWQTQPDGTVIPQNYTFISSLTEILETVLA